MPTQIKWNAKTCLAITMQAAEVHRRLVCAGSLSSESESSSSSSSDSEGESGRRLRSAVVQVITIILVCVCVGGAYIPPANVEFPLYFLYFMFHFL